MKIRSIQELNDLLDKDLAHRRRELTTYRLLTQTSRDSLRNHYLRAALCMLYAHWEGFVKYACTAYVQYVASRGLPLYQLSAGLVAVSMRGAFAQAVETSLLEHRSALIRKVVSTDTTSATFPVDDPIQTASNLDSRVLRGLISMLAADYSPYEPSENLLNIKLLGNRNLVAHGALNRVDSSDFDLLYDTIQRLMVNVQTDVLNSAALERYLR